MFSVAFGKRRQRPLPQIERVDMLIIAHAMIRIPLVSKDESLNSIKWINERILGLAVKSQGGN